MDITLQRLRLRTDASLEPDCQPTQRGLAREFCGDDAAWTRLMSQFGMVLAPPVLSPARTVGHGRFYLGVEGWITGVSSSADYWQLGTEGDEHAGMDMRNRFASATVFASRLSIRKGFPFGLELGTSIGHVFDTEVWTWGLEVKWALFEGFRTGLGILPDVAVRGMVHTLTGDWDFNLTVPTFDIVVSKPIVVAGTMTITPYVSGQVVWILADSELVDLTPDVDAFEMCRPTAGGPPGLNCSIPNGGADFNNNDVFEQVRATRMRLAFGAQFQYEAFTFNGSFHFDLSKPNDADSDVPSDLPRQWSVAFGAGLTY